GSKVGDHVLDPGQTDYEQRTFYVVYDVTKILKQGGNAVGVILGDGWYNQTVVNHGRYGWKDVVYGRPRLILQTHIFYTDGSEQMLVSDESWRGAPGPITFNNVYAGEHYDARLEKPGWDSPGYDDSGWEQVKIVDSPGGKLVSQKLPAIKRMQTIKPVSIKNPKAGVYVYDMGQNFSGWVKLKIEAGEGTIIRLRFAEWLNEDGTIDPASTGTYATGVVQTDKYICKGAGIEVWEPRFTYHGFQYVEVTGFPGTPALENIEGVVVHTSVEKAGKFECSDEMINRIHRTALWTEVSNMHGIPTDCPHRERCGWLGDGFLTSDMTMYNFNAATFWAKFIRDIDTMRRGGVPDNIAPGRRSGGSDPDWGAAFIQLPWNMYLYYGDKSILDEHYAGMSYFMNHLQEIAEDNIIYKGIGSLFSPGRIRPKNTPREFTSTIMYYFSAGAMSRIAGITDRDEDAEKYYKLAQSIKPAFNKKFYNEKEKTYGCQENDCLALAFGLVPEGDETGVAGSLNKYVVEVSNGHLSTGVFGSLYMYSVLGRYGYGDTAVEILNKKTFPSIGYLFSLGATTFWENWGENKFEDRKGDPHGRSKSHPFRSGFDMWFYNGVAGINPDPENPGFKHIIFQPHIISTLKSAKAEYQSIHGLIKSEWRKIDDTFRWSVSIPVNTTAAVYVPAESVDSVMLNGAPAAESKIVEYVGMKNGSALFNVGSGDYTFIVKKN
ncbi:family 78 glycoside hydrolase catalytic domain, partial [bacterium]|nr:family 78 glycoside hydrolase catalytic domain [bacterium]